MSDWDEDASDSVDADEDDSSSADEIACPYCRKPMYDGAEICPACGNYISQEDAPRRKPFWILIAALAVLAAFVAHWVFGFVQSHPFGH